MEPQETAAAVPAAGGSEATVAPGQFARSASGLIRGATFWDAFGINATNGLFIIGIAWLLLYSPLYPGGNIWMAVIFGTLLCVPLMFSYLKLAVIYPRSGGDYTFNSRVLHPAIGFSANVALIMGQIFWIAFGGIYLVSYAITPAFVTAGIQLGNQTMIDIGTWFQGTWQTWLVGFLLVIIIGALLILGGARGYYRYMKIAMALGGTALIAMAIYGFVAPQEQALSNLDELFVGMGATQSASSMVEGSNPAYSGTQTFLMFWWVSGFVLSAFWSAYVGGEVKAPGKNQVRSGIAAQLWLGAWTLLMVGASYAMLSGPFFSNLGGAFETSTFGPGLTPIYATLLTGAMGNGVITMIIFACFGLLLVTVVGSNMLVSSRCILAWGLDRVMPAWVSKVSPRSHVPTSSIYIMVVLSAVAGFLYSFGYVTALGSSWAFLFAYFFVSISAILVPYRRRAVWEASPDARRIFGVPTITVWGILTLISLGVFSLILIADPNYGVSPQSNFWVFIAALIFAALGLIWYYVARYIRSREGINTDLNYAQIPPE